MTGAWYHQVTDLSHERLLNLATAAITTKMIEIIQEYTDVKIEIAIPLHIQGIEIANMELRQKLLVGSLSY